MKSTTSSRVTNRSVSVTSGCSMMFEKVTWATAGVATATAIATLAATRRTVALTKTDHTPHVLEEALGVVPDSLLEHDHDFPHVLRLGDRIPVEHDEIGVLPDLDAA